MENTIYNTASKHPKIYSAVGIAVIVVASGFVAERIEAQTEVPVVEQTNGITIDDKFEDGQRHLKLLRAGKLVEISSRCDGPDLIEIQDATGEFDRTAQAAACQDRQLTESDYK